MEIPFLLHDERALRVPTSSRANLDGMSHPD